MRLTKGTRVEVLSGKEVVMGAWLCGEIVSGNGHMYSVKCGRSALTKEVVVERVPRKAIRPCPPPVEGAGKWAPDDLVEVFHNLSWKMSRIVEDVGGNVFSVRLLGSPQVFRVHSSYLRVRQSWEHGKWFVVGKGSENNTMSMGKRVPITRIKVRIGDDLLFDKEDKETQKHHVVFSRNLKRRSPFGFSCIEEEKVASKKNRSDEKDGSSRQISPLHPSLTSEKLMEFSLRHLLNFSPLCYGALKVFTFCFLRSQNGVTKFVTSFCGDGDHICT
ncbi:uncharacterized protein LOC120010838 isoform X4 [Tripterygium wilfordii]|uniref:uncharacterized protein LOC120010838 isoform X4 n=1 Tax=Tripterygium wilfordii TaxID=458696 RepID=UPI0018F80A08|nr:uncharacterized protein LOC120010838 isoform X4 [Tripterygium wilfordii]XP_038717654.1 uncharacterized protein LOC120010838 isoform X4 [Tripterygium wilfordii]XP_038717655.1 uncharacterized protein LOC120010838 isoform X4 [Tripterygium wilfordii]